MNDYERLSDEALIKGVMLGERAALAPLVERHHRTLLGFLYRMLGGNRPLAEDLVQETFVRILNQRSYRPDHPFKPWMYAIATNLAQDHFRSASNRRITESDDELWDALLDSGKTPEEQMLAAEQAGAVQKALGELRAEYRAALILRYYNELSLQEIADALGVPLGTVKSRLSVGTRRLREMLTALHEEDNR